MAQARTVETPQQSPSSTTRQSATSRHGQNQRKRAVTGWLFVAPFVLIFVAFLILPLAYAFYLSLYSKGLATGVTFAGISNYAWTVRTPGRSPSGSRSRWSRRAFP